MVIIDKRCEHEALNLLLEGGEGLGVAEAVVAVAANSAAASLSGDDMLEVY
jgi:hypothetical protein